MNIMNHGSAQYSEAYNIKCASMFSPNLKEGLYPTFCKIPINGKTEKHSHFEAEVFYIIKGNGELIVDNNHHELTTGDLVKLPPFSKHELVNKSSEELHFLSVYCEDYSTLALPSESIITTAPPTPNGPLHLGHISGPYLAADVLRRYLGLKNKKGIVLSGTDDHQNYVDERARMLLIDGEKFRQKMRFRIKEALDLFGIHNEEFVEPKMDYKYQEKIIHFFHKVENLRVIERKSVDFPYCNECNIHLVDALIEGECPHCGDSSRGGCENCGIVVPPYLLRKKKCGRCHRPSSKKISEVYVFSLSKFFPLIREDLNELNLSPRLKSLAEKIATSNNVEVLLTYPGHSSSAIKVPEKDESLHVWFEMAAHYEKYFLGSFSWVHSFGFDNAFYYLFFIPSLIKAVNKNAKLPHAVLINEFLNLEGKKFSTSRGHAIWADEFKGNVDHLRFYLSLHRPSVESTNFEMAEFQHFSEKLGKRILELRHRAEEVKEISKEPRREVVLACERLGFDLDHALTPKSFNPRHATRLLLNFLDLIFQEKGDPGSEKLMIKTWAKWISPFMPKESARLSFNLGESYES